MSMFGLFKRRRRERLRTTPIPHEWEQILRKNVPLYRRLPEADRRELHGHIQVFLAEKHFEGCGGLELTDEIKLTIAAQACLLLLHRDADYYRRLRRLSGSTPPPGWRPFRQETARSPSTSVTAIPPAKLPSGTASPPPESPSFVESLRRSTRGSTPVRRKGCVSGHGCPNPLPGQYEV
jgi:hypothetical protein